MGVAERIARGLRASVNWPRERRHSDPNFTSSVDVGQRLSEVTGAHARTNATARACVNLITGHLTRCQRHVYQDGKRIDHPLDRVFRQPYSKWDRLRGWAYPINCLLTDGNGYWIVRRGTVGGVTRVTELVPALGSGNEWDQNGNVLYTLSEVSDARSAVTPTSYRTYTRADVVPIHWHGFDGLTSPSPISGAAAIAVLDLAQDFFRKRLRRAGNTGPVFTVTSGPSTVTVSPQAIQDAVKHLQDGSTGVMAAIGQNKMPVLPPDVQTAVIEAFGASELGIVELMRWGKEEIATIYGVSPARLGQLSGGGAGVRTQAYIDQMADFSVNAVAPVADILDSALTMSMLTDEERLSRGLEIKTDITPVANGSARDMAELADQRHARAGLTTANEERKVLGFPDRADGDKLIMPKGAPEQEPTGGEGDVDETDSGE